MHAARTGCMKKSIAAAAQAAQVENCVGSPSMSMSCDFFALSPMRKQSLSVGDDAEIITPEKERPVKTRFRRTGKFNLTLEQSLISWALDKDFQVSVEGHLGCKVCMRHEEWAKIHHVGLNKKKRRLEEEERSENLKKGTLSQGNFVIQDEKNINVRWTLKRHIKGSKHAAAFKAMGKGEHDTLANDVPTDAQMYLTYSIIKENPVAGGGRQYEQRCLDSRSSGDLLNIPAFRCSNKVFYQSVHSIAEAVKLEVCSKLINKKNPVTFMCFAEDACKQYEQMVLRVVYKDRSEENILLKWHWHAGKVTSDEKAEAIADVVNNFSKDSTVVAIFKKHCKAFMSDGAPAEPLAALLVKVRKVLPFRYVGRCLMHAKQRNLENSVNSDTELEALIKLFITEKAIPGSDVWMGGLCRALKNRDRHRCNFSAHVEEELAKVQKVLMEIGEEWTGPQEMPTGRHSVSFAPARFDSLLIGMRTIVLNFRAVIIFLVSLQTPWSCQLLKKLENGEVHVLLAALCEYLEVVSMYVHRDEGHSASKSSLLTAASDFIKLGEDLQSMFIGDKENPPRCTSADYSRGYYQILKKHLASHGEDLCYRTNDFEPLFCWQQLNAEEEATNIANAMKKLQHVIEVFTEACKVDLQLALRAAHIYNIR
jgi:hypothetical protein